MRRLQLAAATSNAVTLGVAARAVGASFHRLLSVDSSCLDTTGAPAAATMVPGLVSALRFAATSSRGRRPSSASRATSKKLKPKKVIQAAGGSQQQPPQATTIESQTTLAPPTVSVLKAKDPTMVQLSITYSSSTVANGSDKKKKPSSRPRLCSRDITVPIAWLVDHNSLAVDVETMQRTCSIPLGVDNFSLVPQSLRVCPEQRVVMATVLAPGFVRKVNRKTREVTLTSDIVDWSSTASLTSVADAPSSASTTTGPSSSATPLSSAPSRHQVEVPFVAIVALDFPAFVASASSITEARRQWRQLAGDSLSTAWLESRGYDFDVLYRRTICAATCGGGFQSPASAAHAAHEAELAAMAVRQGLQMGCISADPDFQRQLWTADSFPLVAAQPVAAAAGGPSILMASLRDVSAAVVPHFSKPAHHVSTEQPGENAALAGGATDVSSASKPLPAVANPAAAQSASTSPTTTTDVATAATDETDIEIRQGFERASNEPTTVGAAAASAASTAGTGSAAATGNGNKPPQPLTARERREIRRREAIRKSHESASVLSVLRLLEQRGFAVIEDSALVHSCARSMKHGAAAGVDSTIALRQNAVDSIIRRVFNVIRQTHYGGTTTWGFTKSSKRSSNSQSASAAAASSTTTASSPATGTTPAASAPPLAHLDTAWATQGINPHTDTTYFSEPVKSQTFGLVHSTKSSIGGDSGLVDGFAIAEYMRTRHPDLFESLVTTPVLSLYSKEGRAFEVARPVISLRRADVPRFGLRTNAPPSTVVVLDQIRFNPVDRSGYVPCPGISGDARKMKTFYEAYGTFEALSRDPRFCIRFSLKVGQLLVFDNFRILHARSAFSGPRVMCGAYVGLDDYASAVRHVSSHRATAGVAAVDSSVALPPNVVLPDAGLPDATSTS